MFSGSFQDLKDMKWDDKYLAIFTIVVFTRYLGKLNQSQINILSIRTQANFFSQKEHAYWANVSTSKYLLTENIFEKEAI